MSISVILFLVGAFADAHADEVTTINPLVPEIEIDASDFINISSTVYFRIHPDTVPGTVAEDNKEHPIISAAVVLGGKLVGGKKFLGEKFLGETLDRVFIHGIEETGSSQVSIAFPWNEIVSSTVDNDSFSDNKIGLYVRNLFNHPPFTEAKLAFRLYGNRQIKLKIMEGLWIVAASFHLFNDKSPATRVRLFHTQLTNITLEYEVNYFLYYTAIVEGPVVESAPVYWVNQNKLQFIGMVTQIVEKDKKIEFVAGSSFNALCSP